MKNIVFTMFLTQQIVMTFATNLVDPCPHLRPGKKQYKLNMMSTLDGREIWCCGCPANHRLTSTCRLSEKGKVLFNTTGCEPCPDGYFINERVHTKTICAVSPTSVVTRKKAKTGITTLVSSTAAEEIKATAPATTKKATTATFLTKITSPSSRAEFNAPLTSNGAVKSPSNPLKRQFLSTVSSFERTSNVKAEQKPSFAVSDVNQITEAPSRNDTADYNKIPIRELGSSNEFP